jgi:hypothetical protein
MPQIRQLLEFYKHICFPPAAVLNMSIRRDEHLVAEVVLTGAHISLVVAHCSRHTRVGVVGAVTATPSIRNLALVAAASEARSTTTSRLTGEGFG